MAASESGRVITHRPDGKVERVYTFSSADVTDSGVTLTTAIDLRGAEKVEVQVTSADDTSGGDLKVDVVTSSDNSSYTTYTVATPDLTVTVDTTGLLTVDPKDFGRYIRVEAETASGTVDVTTVVTVVQPF